ncbi:MAG: enoyl-CoA hydratase-related protein [Dehalococcoidia bacterium]
MSDCIVERHDGVMVIRFNRPERMNAMGGTLLQEMNEAFREGQADDRIRTFVVTGEGRAWCAGADLSGGPDLLGQRPAGEDIHRRYNAIDPVGGAGATINLVYNCDKPTIAAINGVAVGGGLGLATAFDIRVASDQARFSTVFIKRALAPDFGLSWFLPRIVGPQRAADLFFTGRMIGAEEALGYGLVARVVPHEKLMEETMELAGQIAKQPPMALSYTRRALQHSAISTLREQLEYEWGHQRQCLQSEEFKEGVQAFLEKREPDFSRF